MYVITDVHFSAKHDPNLLLHQLVDSVLIERFAAIWNR